MTYMHRQAARRIEPSRIFPGANRAIVVMRNYFNEDPERNPGTGRIAKYARGPDYHHTLRVPLERLTDHVLKLGDGDTIARAYVDAGPVPERELGYRAGLGWIGRNAMLINPHVGSFFFLAVVLTNLDMTVDSPFPHDRCGSCRKCVDTCPTSAITDSRMIDSRLCISYLTIEYKGEIEAELQRKMGDWVFGCDECQDVCPWNRKLSEIADDPVLELAQTNAEEILVELLEMAPSVFQERFGGTPLQRARISGIQRNARIVRKNRQLGDAPHRGQGKVR
jgi:epoxyqueuosine reductase